VRENEGSMADVPDWIVLKRHRDLEGRRHELWVRRVLLALAAVAPLLALFNFFGQRPEASFAQSGVVQLKIQAPDDIRGGLLYQARFHIHAKQDVKDATLVLSTGWLEGMTINTIEPSPLGQASRDGNLALDLGHIPAGNDYILFMQFQVNPTNVGHRDQITGLYDGDKVLLQIDREITVWP
jgi:hypothetical protein